MVPEVKQAVIKHGLVGDKTLKSMGPSIERAAEKSK